MRVRLGGRFGGNSCGIVRGAESGGYGDANYGFDVACRLVDGVEPYLRFGSSSPGTKGGFVREKPIEGVVVKAGIVGEKESLPMLMRIGATATRLFSMNPGVSRAQESTAIPTRRAELVG